MHRFSRAGDLDHFYCIGGRLRNNTWQRALLGLCTRTLVGKGYPQGVSDSRYGGGPSESGEEPELRVCGQPSGFV